MKQFDSSLLHDKLKEYFGFSSFKGNQEAVIRNVLEGKDTFVLMPTGGGKSLCYQLPAMLMDGVAIVISPLIALMKNQVDAMRTFSAESGIAHFLNSSLNKTAVAQVRQDVLDGKTKLLYFAPESLTKEDNVAFLRKINGFRSTPFFVSLFPFCSLASCVIFGWMQPKTGITTNGITNITKSRQ